MNDMKVLLETIVILCCARDINSEVDNLNEYFKKQPKYVSTSFNY